MASTNHKLTCRGCGGDLVDTEERVVRVRTGNFVQVENRNPAWKTEPPDKSVWGHMHERCFLVAIGDPQGVEMVANAAS
jgi:hypothetical protein